MKNLSFYKQVLNLKSGNQIFEYLIDSLKPSNKHWSYFVNWEKVIKNSGQIEIALNNWSI